jgi:putative DNA primase/helicase
MTMKVKGNQKNWSRPLSNNLHADFVNWLGSLGVEIDQKKGLITGGEIGRAYTTVDGRRKQNAWYQVWFDQDRPYGHVERYDVGSLGKWKADGGDIPKLTKKQRAEIERIKEQARLAQQIEQNKAAKRAQTMWERSVKCDIHPYLEAKGVSSHGLKQQDNTLIIPVYNINGVVQTLQFISEEGKKKFMPGGKTKGGYFPIGIDLLAEAKVINYAEGYATGASYFADHQQPVIVAFNAGNLAPVAEAVFALYPQAKHVFIADFDESRTGEQKAIAAAQVIKQAGGHAEVLMPEQVGDYNDHAQALEGELIPNMKPIAVPDAFDFAKTERGRMMHTKSNHQGVLIVNKIDVSYDVIKKRMNIVIPDMKLIADLEEDAAITEIEDRCIQLGVPHDRVKFNLKLLARESNPVAEWITSKPWDGTSRLKALLDTVQAEDNPLKELLMTKWLTSCVAAACGSEGVSSEGILVFVGKQALGKTQWMKTLAPRKEWLLEGATLNPSDKDSVKHCVSHWICELGELGSTFKKADLDQLKAFITRSHDELRLPYDRGFSRYRRRTIFYGSVNENEFLTDPTGNRRFWVVRVNAIDWRHKIDMQQVWAEVKARFFDTGEGWFLTSEERSLLHDSNEMSRTQSVVEDLILQRVKFTSQMVRPVQLTELLRDLGIRSPRVADFKEAARVLTANGCVPRKSNGRKIYDIDYEPVIEDGGIVPPPKWDV